MTRVGYARVSTTDQDLDIQVARLKAAGCEIVRQETIHDPAFAPRILDENIP